jgi:LCP family protein required for cell wall assembly
MLDERPPRLGWSLLKRSGLAGVLIIVLAAAATATAGLEKVSTVAHEVFTQHIATTKGVIVPSYDGEPQTFLLIGSDRRKAARDALDRLDPPHSDTLLLVRLDPKQGQTSVLSIPRDLLVRITDPTGRVYYPEKVNAAYTIGSYERGHDAAANLAALTVENLLGIKLNGIIDATFGGFINVVDSLGCVYVNVDHRYLHAATGLPGDYSAINLQPGYHKLCSNDALSYVRYRHLDSDFTRVARQQDFIRDLREQVSSGNLLSQIDTVSRNVGKAIITSFHGSVSETLQLAKLIAFSQQKPLRQVKFQYSSDNTMIGHPPAAYVTATPQNIQDTVHDFLYGREQPTLPARPRADPGPHHEPPSPRVEHAGRARHARHPLVVSQPDDHRHHRGGVPGDVPGPADGPGGLPAELCLPRARSAEPPAQRLRRGLPAEHPGRLLRRRGHELDQPADHRPPPA